jgi:hypothetical protein
LRKNFGLDRALLIFRKILYFDFLPSDGTKNLLDGEFLKIYLDKQPEIFRTMVNNHLVSLIAVIIKMVSKYDYNF